jgi:ATP/ADP translocase
LDNTVSSPYRWFGWFFFFFIEGYSPFIVSLFWAFANSVSSPNETKKYYSFMVAGSKIGGMLVAAISWYFFSCQYTGSIVLSSTVKHQLIVASSSVLLMIVPIIILWMIRVVPGYRLHGYEAVYKEEKAMKKAGVEKTSIFSGLWLLLKVPYVMGIFGMIFFYEVINVILSYQRLIIADKAANDVAGLSCSLFEQNFFVHLFSFLISLFGTTYLLRKYGERKCLLFIPIATGLLIVVFMLFGHWHWHVLTSVGQKFAKSFGSTLNKIAEWIFVNYGANAFVSVEGGFFAILITSWIAVAYLLGRRYSKVIRDNEIIGVSASD